MGFFFGLLLKLKKFFEILKKISPKTKKKQKKKTKDFALGSPYLECHA